MKRFFYLLFSLPFFTRAQDPSTFMPAKQIGGASAAGKVIVSDATGRGLWANAPADNLSASVYYLTKKGAVSDADISVGSSSYGTNNTAAIQAVLDLAGPAHPIVVYVDGRFSVNGLDVSGNTTIRAINTSCGFILRPNAERPLLRNKHKSFDPAARLDSNIQVVGCFLNGNGRQQGPSGNSTYGLISGVQFIGVYNLTISDGTITDPRTYATEAHNVENYRVDNETILNYPYNNNDGLHADGNCKNIFFRNCTLRTYDDAIAINADDNYYGSTHYTYPYYNSPYNNGPVENLTVENIYIDGGLYGIRILSDHSYVNNFTFRNIGGNVGEKWLEMNRAGLTGVGNIGDGTFENIHCDVTHGSINAPYEAQVATKCRSLTFKNLTRRSFDTHVPALLFESGADVGTLTVDGYTSTDTSIGTNHFAVRNGQIQQFNFFNSNVKKTNGVASSLVSIEGGSVGSLSLTNIDADYFSHVLSFTSGGLGTVRATGIHHGNSTNSALYLASGKFVEDVVLSNFFGLNPMDGGGTAGNVRGDGFYSITSPVADPATVYSDLTFAHFTGGTLSSTSGVWTSSATDNVFGHKGATDYFFPAGGTGGMQLYADATTDGVHFGFSADGPWPSQPYLHIGVEFLSGNVTVYNGYGGTSYLEPIAYGYFYRIEKNGSNFQLTRASSENGTYTVIYTYTDTWSSAMWPMCDLGGNSTSFKLFYPKAKGLTQ